MDKLYTITETRNILQVSKTTLYKWINEGRIKLTRLGERSVRISAEELKRFIKESEE